MVRQTGSVAAPVLSLTPTSFAISVHSASPHPSTGAKPSAVMCRDPLGNNQANCTCTNAEQGRRSSWQCP